MRFSIFCGKPASAAGDMRRPWRIPSPDIAVRPGKSIRKRLAKKVFS